MNAEEIYADILYDEPEEEFLENTVLQEEDAEFQKYLPQSQSRV